VLTAPRNWQHPSVYAIHGPQGRCYGLRQRRTSVYTPLARHGRVTHAAAHRRTSTDVAPTAVCDRSGAHLLRGHFFVASRVAHAAAHRIPLTDVSPTDECHCRRTHLLRAPRVSGQCVAGKQWRTRWVVMSSS